MTSSETQPNDCDVTERLLPNPTPTSISNVNIALYCGQKTSNQEDTNSTGGISSTCGVIFPIERGKLSPSSTNSQDPMMTKSMSIKELSDEDEDDAMIQLPNLEKMNKCNGATNMNTVLNECQTVGSKSSLSLPNENEITASTNNIGILEVGGNISANANCIALANLTAPSSTLTNSLMVTDGPEKIRRKLSVQGRSKTKQKT